MISINYFFFHVDAINNEYFDELNDKNKETKSWHLLIKNLPEAISCFDSQYDTLYINTAAKLVFRVKDEG